MHLISEINFMAEAMPNAKKTAKEEEEEEETAIKTFNCFAQETSFFVF